MSRILTFFIVLLFMSSQAQADIVYQFDATNYSVAPGATVDVEVFIVQTGNTTNDPVDLSTDGLESAAVRVFFDGNPPTDRAEVLSTGNITFNPQFDDIALEQSDVMPGISAGLADSIFVSNPVTGTNILVGTFTFTAGLVPGEVTNLRATDFGDFDDTIAGDANLTPLDDIIVDGVATITVTAIPEPGSMIFLAGIGLVIGLRRRRMV